MTTDALQVRRSQRIKEKVVPEPVEEDEDIEVEQYDEQDGGDDEHRQLDDPDSTQNDNKKRKRAQKKSSTQPKKKAKTAVSNESEFAELRDGFEEHYLFQALNDPEVSVVELATDWVDQYKKTKDVAKKEIVNFILNCVGCLTKIEEHDVSNNESAPETVGEIQTFFKRQKIHEFYIMSKKPEHKHLKKNFVQFVLQIVFVSDEKGLLYENVLNDEEEEEEEEEDPSEDTNILEDLLIWLSSFSVSSVRSLRYISSLTLLTMESALCKVSQKNSTSLEKFKKQLSSEQEKKQSAAVKKRVVQMQSTVDDFIKQSTILESFVEDIVNTTFIHRFKDVDHYIRVESMSALGEWMEILPESFYSVKYLKYLGWVLSDSNSSVRLQVLKTLVRLLKHNTVVTGVRQFFERFKDRIVEMALSDIDIWVRINAITLLSETNKLGFLDEIEISKISSLIFDVNEKRLAPMVANFIKTVQEERATEALEEHSSSIESYQADFPLNFGDVVRISTLIKIFEGAHLLHQSNESKLAPPHLEPSDYANTAKVFTELKGYDQQTLTTAIDYFLLDTSTVTAIEDENVTDLVQLTSSEKSVLLAFIHGLTLGITNNKDAQSYLMSKIVSQTLLLLKKSESSERDLSVFIQIFVLIPLSIFEEHNEGSSYKSVVQSILKYFKNNNVVPLEQEFELLMDTLRESESSTALTEIHSFFKDLLAELFIEFGNFLKSSDFEFTDESLEQLYEDYIFKIGILGSSYETTALLPLFEDVRYQLLISIDTQELGSESVNLAITGVYKLWLSAFVWKFESLLNSNELYDLEKELKVIVDYLDAGKDIIVNRAIPLSIRTHVASYVISCYSGLKSFFGFYEESEKTNLSNAARLKELEFNSFKLDEELIDGLKDVFLSNEAVLASTMEVLLEREDSEDIAYNSIKSEFDPELDESQESAQWKAETELVEFTDRLLMFAKFGMIGSDFTERMSLNAELLGDLFYGAINDGLDDEEEEEEADVVEHNHNGHTHPHHHTHNHAQQPEPTQPQASAPLPTETRIVQGREFENGEEFVDDLGMEDAE